MIEWMLALEHGPFAAAVRASPYLYPLANVAHILGALVFFASVAAMDARLLGALRSLAPADVLGPCRRIALAAFCIQAASGFTLLAPEAGTIARNPAFLVKMLTVVLALTNAAALDVLFGRSLRHLPAGLPIPRAARGMALGSLAAWLLDATLGRLIAYV